MSPVTCIGVYSPEDDGDTMVFRNSFTFRGKESNLMLNETKMMSARCENKRESDLS